MKNPNSRVMHVAVNEESKIVVVLLSADDEKGNQCFVSCSAHIETEFGKNLSLVKAGQLAKFTLSWMQEDVDAPQLGKFTLSWMQKDVDAPN